MTPYLLLLFAVVIIAYLGRRYGSRSLQLISLSLIVLLLIVFAGLRDRLVGTDTSSYVSIFGEVNSFSDIWRTTEVGFNVLMLLAKSISTNYAAMLILIASITVSLYVSAITHMTKRYETALFLFITLGAYTFAFNGARQAIAAAICFFALPWLLKRKPIGYFLWIALAFSFHHSALIAAPLYLLATPRTGWRQLSAIAVATAAAIVFLKVFVQLAAELLNDRYVSYAVASEGGGVVVSTFLVIQGLVFFLLKEKVVDTNGNYQRLLNIYLIGFIPVIAAVVSNVNPSGLLRLHPYFAYTAILLWPMIFQSIKNQHERNVLGFAFILFYITFFYMTTSAFSDLAPYVINGDFL